MQDFIFDPIKKLLFDSKLSSYRGRNSRTLLNHIIREQLSSTWQESPHLKSLNFIADKYGFKDWRSYVNHIELIRDKIDIFNKTINQRIYERWETEDPLSIAWCHHIRKKLPNYKNSKVLFNEYLQIRNYQFERKELNKINIFGAMLGRNIDDCKDHGTFLKPGMDYFYFNKCNFIFTKLYGLYFRNGFFREVDFNHSSFSWNKFKFGSDFMGCTFAFCSLLNATITHSYMRETIFYKSNLEKANFMHSNFVGPLFLWSNLQKVNFKKIKANHVTFLNCDLRESDFTGAKIQMADCRVSDLRNVKGLDMNKIIVDKDTLL